MLRQAIAKEPAQQCAVVPMQPSPQPKVAVCLATYNSHEYLTPQLQSIHQQTHRNWSITISDDGSTDATLEVICRHRSAFAEGRLFVRQGPQRGFSANFLSMVCDASLKADHFAFCDQDDIWRAHHLERAVAWLESVPESCPALYCSRTRQITAAGEPTGLSPLFDKPPSFRNALVQSLAGGNTMVFNAAARNLLVMAGQPPIVSHDWWTYMLVSGAGGLVHYEATPSVDYRQHGGNLIGANSSMKARMHRLKRMFAGDFKSWNTTNLAALSRCRHLLGAEQQQTLERFAQARTAGLLRRCIAMRRSGLYRQTLFGNLGLAAATVLGKI